MFHLPYFSDNSSLGNCLLLNHNLPAYVHIGWSRPTFCCTLVFSSTWEKDSCFADSAKSLSFPGIFAVMRFIRPLSALVLLSSSLELSGFNPLCFLASWPTFFFLLPKFSSFSRPLKDHCPLFWNGFFCFANSYSSLKPGKNSFSLPLLLVLVLASLKSALRSSYQTYTHSYVSVTASPLEFDILIVK